MLPYHAPSQHETVINLIPPNNEEIASSHDLPLKSLRGRHDFSASSSSARSYSETSEVEQPLVLLRNVHHISSDASIEDVADNEKKKRHCGELHKAKSEEQRRTKRRAANRKFAAESRRRKKELLLGLQNRAALLSKNNLELENENEELRKKLRLELQAASIRQKRRYSLNLLRAGGVVATRFHDAPMIPGHPIWHRPKTPANNVVVSTSGGVREYGVGIATSFGPRETLHTGLVTNQSHSRSGTRSFSHELSTRELVTSLDAMKSARFHK